MKDHLVLMQLLFKKVVDQIVSFSTTPENFAMIKVCIYTIVLL